jgi:hypothetical protein
LVAAALLAIVWNLPRTRRLGHLPRLTSFGISAVGAVWFVLRIGS